MHNFKSVTSIIIFLFAGLQSCSSRQHAKINPSTIDAAQIMTSIKEGKNIYYEDKTITGDIDFTTQENPVKEGKGLKRVYVSSGLTFINCVFTGKIIGYKAANEEITVCDFSKNLSFTDCQFQEVSLRESIIHGYCSFTGSFFTKKTTFEGTRFMGEAGFGRANFGEELRFQNVLFYNKCNFMDAVFGKTSYFQGSTFYGDAQMSSSQWYGYADLSICLFHTGCYFNYANFKDRSVFNSSVFRGRAEFLKTTFTGNAEFKNCNYFGFIKTMDASVLAEMNHTGSVFFINFPDTMNIKKTGETKIIVDQVKTGFVK